MKKIKLAICAMCLLFAGVILSACGEKTFEAENVSIGATQFTYDGASHIFEVSYLGKDDIAVSYSLDKEDFVSADQLNFSEVGSYKIYYKISADGYTDYVSDEPVEMNINPIDVIIYIKNVYQVENEPQMVPEFIVTGDNILDSEFDPEFSIADLPSVGSQEAGNSYTVSATATKENYNISFVDAKYYIIKSTDEVIRDQTFDQNVDSMFEDGKTYIFDSCTFNTAVSSTKNVSLMFNNCTFNAGDVGTGEIKCLYLTSVSDLTIDTCTFNGRTTVSEQGNMAYTIDINLHSTNCDNILIMNNYFNTVSNHRNVPISIKVRFGDTDKPTDITGTIGTITGEVRIESNTFNGGKNIYLGALPNVVDDTSVANSSTGDFLCVISSNYSILNVYELYTSNGNGYLLPTELEEGDEMSFGLQADNQ